MIIHNTNITGGVDLICHLDHILHDTYFMKFDNSASRESNLLYGEIKYDKHSKY